MKFKAVVFDLDGTLLDTLEDLADAMNSVLAERGWPVHDTEAYKYFVGDGMRTLVQRTLPKDARDPETIDQCFTAMRDTYSRNWQNKTKPYSGVPELLAALSSQGLRLTVLSNKSDDFTKLMVEQLLPYCTFELVFGERAGIPKKPDPAGALEIAEKLGVQSQECLYLGDTAVDMRTANAAGMYPVGVLWGFRKADELIENGAKVLIAEPLEALKLL